LGILLSVSLMMLPDFAARFWTDQLVGLMGISIGIGFLSSVIGIIVSYHLNTPTGPTIILASGTLYLFSILYGQRSSLVIAKIHRPDLVP
ncbi:MAG: metal ABC transporter permease, partial [Alphaproteobacteria bacterium]|nr:metal ABC transporter permease [Alphaproteobacteria bacterium]